MKRFLFLFLAICSLGMAVISTTPALAVKCPAGTIGAEDGVERKSLAECDITVTGNEANQVTNKIESAINVGIGFIGLVTVIVIIVGGVQYVTSQGDSGKAVKARTTIIYGVVGLVICLLAYAIVNFVLAGVFS